MSDMDFSQVKGVRISEGEVVYIDGPAQDGEIRCLWKRKFQYPAYGAGLMSTFTSSSGDKVTVHNVPYELRDDYSVRQSICKPVPNAEGSKDIYIQEPVVMLPSDDDVVDDDDYASSYTWIRKGLSGRIAIYIRLVSSESDAGAFHTLPDMNILSFVISSKYFKLYAAPESMSEDWEIGKFETSELHGETEFKLIEHETDIEIYNSPSATDWLVSPRYTYKPSGTMFSIPIDKVVSNFDSYKSMYEEKTGGQYPKSMYPYLVGVQSLVVTVYKKTTLMNFGFRVRR